MRMLDETAQWSKKSFAMCVDDNLVMRISHASLGYQSVMTYMYWLPWFVVGNSPGASIAMKLRGLDGENSCDDRSWRYRLPLCAQLSHLRIVV